MLFASDRSKLITPSPRRMPRPLLPNVKFAGCENASVLNHRPSVRSLAASDGSPETSARCAPAENALVVLVCVVTVNGAPDCSVPRTPIDQPPTTCPSQCDGTNRRFG